MKGCSDVGAYEQCGARMRLQKFLAEAGIDSRRKCEELIAKGLVLVNGLPAEIGCVVDPERDAVTYQGKPVTLAQERVVLALNKPQCVVSTMHDPQGRTTVADYFKDFPQRLYPVGRLDYDSEGLIIMTNDGALAYRMTHPKFTVEKTYLVHCDGILTDEQRTALERGIPLADGMTAPARIQNVRKLKHGNTAFEITIHEGRNRQVRRMLAAVEHNTLLLRRVAIGPIKLGALGQGKWRSLTAKEAEGLDALLR